MPFQPVINCLQVDVHSGFQTPPENHNIMYLEVASDHVFVQADADSIADVFHDAWTHLVSHLNNNYKYTGVTVTDVRTEGAAQFNSAHSGTVTGTSSTDIMPLECCAVITWLTDVRTRSGRGRSFISGWGETANVGNLLSSGSVTALEEFAQEIVDNSFFCVASRVHEGSPREEALAFPITGFVVGNKWHYNKRRNVV